MKIVSTSVRPVPLTGGRLLYPEESVDDFEITDHERALAAAGRVALFDSAGRKRTVKPPEPDDEDGTA